MIAEHHPIETELAFNLLDDRVALENHRLFHGAETTTRRLVSTYFDTPGQTLARAGWSLRIREDGHRREQTAKGPTKVASRPEWSTNLNVQSGRHGNRPTLNADALRNTPVWQIIDGQFSALTPVFQTHIARKIRNIYTPAATIEVAHDVGLIQAAASSRSCPINDVELELKSGDTASLFRVAIELALDIGITMEPSTKAQRGYNLINDAGPSIHKHDGLTLEKDSTVFDSFHYTLSEVIAHLRSNIPAAHQGMPGGIHQMRVGLRRLRATLVLYRSGLHRGTVIAYDQELQKLGHLFGAARDWDVLITETLPAAHDDLPGAGWLTLLSHAATIKQAAAHDEVRKTIEGRYFNSVILSLMGWAEDRAAFVTSMMSQPTKSVIPHLLSRLADKMNGKQEKLDGSAERIHALRKAAKKVRYAVEFTETLYSPKSVKKFLGPCKDIQQVLGVINDVSMTRSLLNALVVDRPALAPAVAELDDWLTHRRIAAEQKVPKLLRHLQADRPYWT